MPEQVMDCTEVPLEHLEAQICEGAAHIAAGMGRWLLLVGEFDRRKGYSKVRAITRVVTPETEATLIDWACAVPTSQIERVVAGRKRVDVLEAAAAHEARHLDIYDDDDGSAVGMFRLDPDEGAALRAALTLGKEILRDQKRSAERSDTTPATDDCSSEALRPKVSNVDALGLMVETMLAADHHKDISRHERTLVMVHLDGDKAHIHDGPNICPETAKRLSCDACVCGVLMRDGTETLDLGRTQRLPNRAQRRALMVRDGGCRFPGCVERRFVEAHHVMHWTDGGLTDLDNLVLLCWHHHHAVHEGGFKLRFEHNQVTAWRPDGRLLDSESLLAEGPGIVEQNNALGLMITPETTASEWDGTRLGPELLADSVSALLSLEDRHRRETAATSTTVSSEPLDDYERDYPDVIVLDDEDDDDWSNGLLTG